MGNWYSVPVVLSPFSFVLLLAWVLRSCFDLAFVMLCDVVLVLCVLLALGELGAVAFLLVLVCCCA